MKLKFYLILSFLFLFGILVQSQNFEDLIITKNQDTIYCEITLINEYNIFYNYKKRKSIKSTYISKEKVSEFLSETFKVNNNLKHSSIYPSCDTCSNWIVLKTGDTLFQNIRLEYLLDGKYHFRDLFTNNEVSYSHYSFLELKSAVWDGIEYYPFTLSNQDHKLLYGPLGSLTAQKKFMGYNIIEGEINLMEFWYNGYDTKYHYAYCIVKDFHIILIPEKIDLFLQRMHDYLSDNPGLIERIENKELGYDNLEEIFRIYNQEYETQNILNDSLAEPEYYSFPLGCKFQLQLDLVDESHFKYTVNNFEPFQEIVDLYNNDSIFPAQVRGNTMDVVFCISTRGNEKEDGSNYLTTLYVRNNSVYYIDYNAEILIKGAEEYIDSNVLGIFPGIISTEMWSYPIDYIALDSLNIKQ